MSRTATFLRPFLDVLYAVTPRLGGRIAYSDLQWECGEEIVTSREHGVARLGRDVLSEDSFEGEFAELEIVAISGNSSLYGFSLTLDDFKDSVLAQLPFLGYGVLCEPEKVEEFHHIGAAIEHLQVQLQDWIEADIVRALMGDVTSPEKAYEALAELNAYAFASWGGLPIKEHPHGSLTRTPLMRPVTTALEFVRNVSLDAETSPTGVSAAADQLQSEDVMAKVAAIHALSHIAEEAGAKLAAVVDLLGNTARSLNRGETAMRSPVAQAIASSLSVVTTVTSPPPIDLSSADLHGVSISRANLANVSLKDAHLEHSTLSGVSLRGADLRDTDLSGAHLIETDISNAIYDRSTRWPAGFDPDSAGARLAD